MPEGQVLLFEDGFGQMRAGSIGSEVGAHADTTTCRRSARRGIGTSRPFLRARPRNAPGGLSAHNGQPVLLQTYENKLAHSHPMVVGGDNLWRDYTLTARFAPASDKGRCGLVFRYRNDRCNYFFGVEGREGRAENDPA